MLPKLVEPRFESGSYGEKCHNFFKSSHQLQLNENSVDALNWKTRTLTWAHQPYRYWLEQSGVEVSNIFGTKRIEHKMFHVALMGAISRLDGRRELDRWYITQPTHQPEKIVFLSNTVQEPELDKATGAMTADIDFMLTNDLHHPNLADLKKLDYILEIGRLDGSEPLYKK